jgi:hypothetical protein
MTLSLSKGSAKSGSRLAEMLEARGDAGKRLVGTDLKVCPYGGCSQAQ